MTVLWALMAMIVAYPATAAEPFPEWPRSAWEPLYDRAIRHGPARRVLAGDPDCAAQPDRVATRCDAAAVLSRLVWHFNLDEPDPGYLPADVPWNHPCAEALRVITAARLYPLPRGAGYCGSAPLTRGDWALMMDMLMRAMEGEEPPPRLSDVPAAAARAVETLIARHMLVKFSDLKLHLDRPVYRWQVCVTVHRLMVWNEAEVGRAAREPVGRPLLRSRLR